MALPTPVTSNPITGTEDAAVVAPTITASLSQSDVPSGGMFTIPVISTGLPDGTTVYLQGASGPNPPSPLPYLPGVTANILSGAAVLTFVTPPNNTGLPLGWTFDVTNVAPPTA